MIEFRRREFDVIHFHFQFIFKSRDDQVIGMSENWNKHEVQKWINDGQKLQEEETDRILIADNEFIVGLKIGVDMFGGIANV